MIESNQVKTELYAIRELADLQVDPQTMQLKLEARANPHDFEHLLYELFPGSVKMEGSVAWMSIKGPLRNEDYQNIMESIDALERDTSVSAVIFDINSPGGEVSGCPETAEAIAKMEKPTLALANGMMCSAAYWAGSQADKVVASDSTTVGSVGVIATHASLKGAYENMGIKITEVARGSKKNLFSPNHDLTDKGKNELQAQVDLFFGKFVEAVESKRDIKEEVLDSGTFCSAKAIEVGLVDSIVNNRNTMSVFNKSKGQSPPKTEDGGSKEAITREEFDGAISKVNETLTKLTGSLEPMVAEFNKQAADRKAEEEEAKALETLNASRKARGLKPLKVEDDMDDDDYKEKKEAPGKHEKSEDKEDEKDAKFEKLQSQIDKLAGLITANNSRQMGQGATASFNIDSVSGDEKVLKSSGRKIPVEKSWKWVYSSAPAIRGSLRATGTFEEISEFDLMVAQISEDLTIAGITEPKDVTKVA